MSMHSTTSQAQRPLSTTRSPGTRAASVPESNASGWTARPTAGPRAGPSPRCSRTTTPRPRAASPAAPTSACSPPGSAGDIDAIVTWHNDRLHCSRKELEAFIDLVERTGVRFAAVTGGDYDLTTPDSRLAARIVGAVARKESEDRSRPVRGKHLERAELEKPAAQLGWASRRHRAGAGAGGGPPGPRWAIA